MKNYIIYYSERFVPLLEATTNVLSASNQYGLNVFEGIRIYQDKDFLVFRLDDHLQRLQQSLSSIGLFENVISKDRVLAILAELIKRNNISGDFSIRMTYMVDEIGSWHAQVKPALFIAPIEKERIGFSEPLKAEIVDVIRNSSYSMDPGIKCGANYINGRYALLEAKAKGADVAIMKNMKGYISESSGACVFIVKNGAVFTPTLKDDILNSITRDTIIKICHELCLPVFEQNLTENDLCNADEIFLCGSAAEIIPVVLDTSIQTKYELTKTLFGEYRLAVCGQKMLSNNWTSIIQTQ